MTNIAYKFFLGVWAMERGLPAALAVLDTISRPEFLAQVRVAGNRLHAGLTRLTDRYGFCDVRGAGLLLAVRLMPSLRVSGDEIDDAVDTLASCLDAHL